MRQQFLSDNNAGMCPEALAALIAENATGHDIGYGDDKASLAAERAIADLFETDCDVFFVFNGTSANVRAGDTFSCFDLLYGMMLPSGNDVALLFA